MITRRALNRTLLHRQSLLERSDQPVTAMVERLVGMQAQEPFSAYYGLWSRLRGFTPDDLGTLLTDRTVVRAPLHRATIHLVTAADHARVEPVLRDVLRRRFGSSPFKAVLPGLDPGEFTATAHALLVERPRTRAELSTDLARHWPDRDPESLGIAATHLLPVVQIPPRGVWGRSGRATWAAADHWLGTPGSTLDPAPDLEGFLRRYLAAFGPATVKDMTLWSGLTRLKDVVRGMDLRVVHDETGRELFDVPDAPLLDPDTPAPARFLPEFDNLLLGHDDRTRVISDEDYRRGIVIGGKPTLLVDGFVHGTWTLRDGLDIRIFRPLTDTQREDVLDEGTRLLKFADASGEVRITDA
ncbi:winged helix DNA-binding domain-containing protein [Saccharothrix variisporea]|uniref:Winged helix DNA-binding protein n=1 Tax=Saccharothrix variisporea TaxID=543527 RepID=A0A495WZU4_9PSEU|nr:winged helix DNA-binding domain-containing protein [Saccharothrix variisporea]RKT67381.1 winged helix DNA-binding protein [Saccharothrix variisporea]